LLPWRFISNHKDKPLLTRLPRWVEVGAFLLAFLAGSVNAVGLLGFSHQSVSHLTGTTSLLGLALADLALTQAGHLLLTLLSFLAGAALSGVLIPGSALKLGRHYGFSLLIEAFLLLMAMLTLQQGSDLGVYLASMACGLQNAMVTTYSGSIIRTTHLSGIFTDLGIMLGNRVRGVPINGRRLLLFLLLIGGFVVGGLVGTLLFRELHFTALLMPAGLAVFLAVVYWEYARRYR
tara:strand:+ start:5403 stop:6104 length:702 start_codon:yes stop_codon:yes gene_type:complete